MKYNPEIHHRKSIRPKEYDYSQAGHYFVTICTHNREHLFGEIADGVIKLNKYGKIVKEELLRTEEIRQNIKIDYFVIMPNHIHLILIIKEQYLNYNDVVGVHCNEPLRQNPYNSNEPFQLQNTEKFGKSTKNSLSTIIKLLKSTITKQINDIRNSPGLPIWQRNYYEHIIRNEKELNEIRKYIHNNPLNWNDDEYNN